MKSVCNEDYLPKGGGAVTAVNAGLEGGGGENHANDIGFHHSMLVSTR